MTSWVSSAQAPYIAGRKMRAKGWTKSSGGVEPEIISPTLGERKSSANAAGHVRTRFGFSGSSDIAVRAIGGEVVSMGLLAAPCAGALPHGALGACSMRAFANSPMFGLSTPHIAAHSSGSISPASILVLGHRHALPA